MLCNLIVAVVVYINLVVGTYIKLYTFKEYTSLYLNYTSITLIKKRKKVLVQKVHTQLLLTCQWLEQSIMRAIQPQGKLGNIVQPCGLEEEEN